MSIRFAGHTMGAPGRDLPECMQLFKDIGYDGIEVRVAANGQIDSETMTDTEARAARSQAEDIGIEVACLTSYFKDFVSDARETNIANLKRVAELAALLDCDLIRLYGGGDQPQQGMWFVENWNRTVSGTREIAEFAAGLGVRICIETHVGSLTMSVRDTVRMLDDIGMQNVGILFDYAWVDVANVEKGAAGVRAAAGRMFHVHAKDWVIASRFPLEKTSCLIGEGSLPWPEVLQELKRVGYSGYISDEYEKFWYPDALPEPEIGMKANLEFMKAALG